MAVARKPIPLRGDPDVEAYSRRLMEVAASVRLPELFSARHPEALYYLPDRHGVSVVALRRASLTDDQLLALLRYRLGQYVHPSINFIDVRLVHETRMEHEPPEAEHPRDVHFIAGSRETGEILCYAVLRSLPDATPRMTLQTRERELFPVEKVHGSGIFNRLRVLPGLPLTKVYELGRYVKNHCLHPLNALSARAPVEVAIAVFRTLVGPMNNEIEAFVGDLEEGVAKHTLDFFHIPTVVIRGTVPYSAEASYFFPRHQYCAVYPFAVLVTDLSVAEPRLRAVEEAVSLEGKQALVGLFQLKKKAMAHRSSLEPPDGLEGLSAAELPEQGGAMQVRKGFLDIAVRLRSFEAFAALSDAEMRILGSHLQRCDFAAGQAIVSQGEEGADLFLIESGEAEVRCHTPDGGVVLMARLSDRDYFGEIALLTGGKRTADVVAMTPVQTLRLSADAYRRFLTRVAEVEQRIARTAASRASETIRRIMTIGTTPQA